MIYVKEPYELTVLKCLWIGLKCAYKTVIAISTSQDTNTPRPCQISFSHSITYKTHVGTAIITRTFFWLHFFEWNWECFLSLCYLHLHQIFRFLINCYSNIANCVYLNINTTDQIRSGYPSVVRPFFIYHTHTSYPVPVTSFGQNCNPKLGCWRKTHSSACLCNLLALHCSIATCLAVVDAVRIEIRSVKFEYLLPVSILSESPELQLALTCCVQVCTWQSNVYQMESVVIEDIRASHMLENP